MLSLSTDLRSRGATTGDSEKANFLTLGAGTGSANFRTRGAGTCNFVSARGATTGKLCESSLSSLLNKSPEL
jgi:hypothetical protein